MAGEEHSAWLVITPAGKWDVICSCGYAQRFSTEARANARAVDHVERMTGRCVPVEVRS